MGLPAMHLLDQFAMNRQVAAHHRLGAEMLLDTLLSCGRQVFGSGPIIEQLVDRLGESSGICRGNEATGDPILDHLGNPTDFAGDHCSGCPERVEDAGSETFLETGMDVEIESREPRRNVVLKSNPVDAISNAILLRQGIDRLGLFSVSDQNQMRGCLP